MLLLRLVFPGSWAALLDAGKNQRLFVRKVLRKFRRMRTRPSGQAGGGAQGLFPPLQSHRLVALGVRRLPPTHDASHVVR